MIDLEKVCETLSRYNVRRYRQAGSVTEIEFFLVDPASSNGRTSGVEPENGGSIPSAGTTTAEQQMPMDLRTENINNADHVLNWSTTPDPQEGAMPLTGEAPEA